MPTPVSLTNQPPQQRKERPQPDETFSVLATLTNSLISLSTPAFTALAQQSDLVERLMTEWRAWLNFVDEYVNRQGEIFGQDQARSWISALDSWAEGSQASLGTGFGGGFGWAAHASGWGSRPTGFGQPAQAARENPLPGMKEIRDQWVTKVGFMVGRKPPFPGFEAMDEL